MLCIHNTLANTAGGDDKSILLLLLLLNRATTAVSRAFGRFKKKKSKTAIENRAREKLCIYTFMCVCAAVFRPQRGFSRTVLSSDHAV